MAQNYYFFWKLVSFIKLNSVKPGKIYADYEDNFVILAQKLRAMRNKNRFMMLLAVVAVLAVASCRRNVFDEDKYIELVKIQSPVDSIDASHTFSTTTAYPLKVSATVITQRGNQETTVNVGAKRLRILTGDPASGEAATILADVYCKDGDQLDLTFAAPVGLTQFYAALVDSVYYTVKPFTADETSINFTNPRVTHARRLREPTNQVYTYCYEDEQPEANEYCYNDVVLRMSFERTGETEINLNVSLAAVGSSKKLSAAIRLPGYQYADIESVTTVGDEKGEGETFDGDYNVTGQAGLPQDGLLMRANKTNEAVIRLFEDAHWAIDPNVTMENGLITRKTYNVTKTTSVDNELVNPRSITYKIKFKSGVDLNQFRLDNIDPFVVNDYNGLMWEIHLYPFQGTEVFHEYSLVNSVKLLPWAILVPKGDFRYPILGYNIGYFKKGALFGTYMTRGHSFGEWVENQATSTDWYNYPTLNMAF